MFSIIKIANNELSQNFIAIETEKISGYIQNKTPNKHQNS